MSPTDNQKATTEFTGSSVDYYKVRIELPRDTSREPYEAECNDIIETLGMSFAEGNAFKALWRRAAARTLGKTKKGYDHGLYDAEKVVFFGQRLVAISKNQNKPGLSETVEQYQEVEAVEVPKAEEPKRPLYRYVGSIHAYKELEFTLRRGNHGPYMHAEVPYQRIAEIVKVVRCNGRTGMWKAQYIPGYFLVIGDSQ